MKTILFQSPGQKSRKATNLFTPSRPRTNPLLQIMFTSSRPICSLKTLLVAMLPPLPNIRILIISSLVSIISASVCVPSPQKGVIGEKGKPGKCGCHLVYERLVIDQLRELNRNIHLLKKVVESENDKYPPLMTQESKKVQCVLPESMSNWITDDKPQQVLSGTRVTITCRKGFRISHLTGTKEITLICGKNGTWNTVIPKCKEVTCTVPPTPPHVYSSTDDKRMSVAALVSYNCFSGYKIRGTVGRLEKTVVCEEDGTWSEDPPICEPIYCSIGMKDWRIRDEQISASSYYSSIWLPQYARLDREILVSTEGGTWMPGGVYLGEWIMVDLIRPTSVTGVITQGHLVSSSWITGFTISYGNISGDIMVPIQNNRKDLIFSASPSDGDSHTVNYFEKPIAARYLQLTVHSFNNKPALRMDYLTC